MQDHMNIMPQLRSYLEFREDAFERLPEAESNDLMVGSVEVDKKELELTVCKSAAISPTSGLPMGCRSTILRCEMPHELGCSLFRTSLLSFQKSAKPTCKKEALCISLVHS